MIKEYVNGPFAGFYNILVITLSFSVHVIPENYWKCDKFLAPKKYGGLLYRPMKKRVKGEGWLTGLSRYNE